MIFCLISRVCSVFFRTFVTDLMEEPRARERDRPGLHWLAAISPDLFIRYLRTSILPANASLDTRRIENHMCYTCVHATLRGSGLQVLIKHTCNGVRVPVAARVSGYCRDLSGCGPSARAASLLTPPPPFPFRFPRCQR